MGIEDRDPSANPENHQEQDQQEMSNARRQAEEAFSGSERGPQAPPKFDPKFAEEKIGGGHPGQAQEAKPEENANPKPEGAPKKEYKYSLNPDAKDYYDRFGLPRDASQKDIEAAYREAARFSHPDRNPGNEKAAAGYFNAFQEAFDNLGNEERRKRYDRDLSMRQRRDNPRSARPGQSQKPESENANPKPEASQQEAKRQAEAEKHKREQAEKTEREFREANRAAEARAKANAEEIRKKQEEKLKKAAERAAEEARKQKEKEEKERMAAEKAEARKAAKEKIVKKAKVFVKATVRGAKAFKESYFAEEEKRRGKKAEAKAEKEAKRQAERGANQERVKREAEANKEFKDNARADAQRRAEEAKKAEESRRQKAEEQISLNFLQKEIDRLRKEIEKLRAQKESSTEPFENGLKELLSKRERLAEKVTGKSMAEVMAEAEKKVAQVLGYATREDYVRALSPVQENNVRADKEKDLINKEFSALSEKEQKKYGNNHDLFRQKMEERAKKLGLSQDEIYGLLGAGYKIQDLGKKGFFSLRITFRSERKITAPNGKKVWMKTKDFMELAKMQGENYKSGIADEARRQTGEKWGNEVRRQTEESLEKTARDLDAATKRMQAVYRERRNNIFSELWGLGNGQLSEAQLRARQRAFGQKPKSGKGIDAFLDAMFNGSGKLSGLNGDVKKNSKIFNDGLRDFGYDDFGGQETSDIFSGSGYEQSKKQKGGLLKLFLGVLREMGLAINIKASYKPK